MAKGFINFLLRLTIVFYCKDAYHPFSYKSKKEGTERFKKSTIKCAIIVQRRLLVFWYTNAQINPIRKVEISTGKPLNNSECMAKT